jgi:hypothetical protein
MDLRRLGMYLYSLIGRTQTRRSSEEHKDAPRNVHNQNAHRAQRAQNVPNLPNLPNVQIGLEKENSSPRPAVVNPQPILEKSCPKPPSPNPPAKQQDIRMVLARQKFADLPDIVRPLQPSRIKYTSGPNTKLPRTTLHQRSTRLLS